MTERVVDIREYTNRLLNTLEDEFADKGWKIDVLDQDSDLSDMLIDELVKFDKDNFLGDKATASSKYSAPLMTSKDIRESIQKYKGKFIIIRESGDKIISVTQIVTRNRPQIAVDLHIASISVDNDYRGKGISGKVIDNLGRYAQSQKIDYLTLRVDPLNRSAVKSYLKNGFAVVGSRKKQIEGVDVVTLAMSKFLKNDSVLEPEGEMKLVKIDDFNTIDLLTQEGWVGVNTVEEENMSKLSLRHLSSTAYYHWT